MSPSCPHCSSPLPEGAIDRVREIATCPGCQRLVDVQPLLAVAAQSPGAAGVEAPRRMRPVVALPAGLTIAHEGHDGIVIGYRGEAERRTLIITRRWRRVKHYVMASVVLGLGFWWSRAVAEDGIGVWTSIAAVMLLGWVWMLAGMLFNRTTIRVEPTRISVSHGPLPSPILARSVELPVLRIKQLFAKKAGSFEVRAALVDGQELTLVRPLVSAEQALFIEQQLEQQLGLVDFEVPGEVGGVLAVGSLPGPAKLAIGAASALPLVIMVGVGGLVFALFPKTRLSGQLELGGPADAVTFAPNDCDSGQPTGYFGVELRGEQAPGIRVRVVQDPVRGPAVVVHNGGSQQSLTAADCELLEVRVRPTNTTVNDVRVLEGSLDARCSSLRGRVDFEGCY
ncbi:MAG: hypothetical protein KF718_17270 [Polyangiaceae bacterium]|nr:hypothetical protein [Polyangiaceae bacterium]